MSWANVEWYRQWRREVDAALLREEEKLLAAARAAVVEAAKQWYRGGCDCFESSVLLIMAVEELSALEGATDTTEWPHA